ncbi:hypothetical protein O1Q96_00085 (plasmid) [Streptomyces sp. Qhu-G9]|nr:hypothetical protein [Streptomyces aurantiacus]WAU78583.1 hypothetical protein O1Q96_00085 [Streptomyces aurantiacus]
MPKMDEGGQQAVDEHQAVFRPAAHGPPPRPGGQLGLVTLMPQRTYLGYEFSDHIACQTRDPTVADDHCASPVLHHPTMINHRGPDVSPLVVHELVRVPRGTQLVQGIQMSWWQHSDLTIRAVVATDLVVREVDGPVTAFLERVLHVDYTERGHQRTLMLTHADGQPQRCL